jgi:glutathione S-transferase
VLWTLRELDLPHRVIRLDAAKGEHKSDTFRRLNPAGKVPVLLHGDQILTESLAIMEYLNDISRMKNLIPKSISDRYVLRKIIHYGVSEVEVYLWIADQATRLKRIYSWPKGTYEESIDRVKQGVKQICTWIEGNDYLAGGQYSIADIYYYQLITWAKKHGVEFSFEIDRYVSSLANRPAFPETMSTE